MKQIKNPDKKWFQFWKPDFIEVDPTPATDFMCSVFSDIYEKSEEIKEYMGMETYNKACLDTILSQAPRGFMSMFVPKLIENPNRKPWQIWKPKLIPEPVFEDTGETVEIDIVRGKCQTMK